MTRRPRAQDVDRHVGARLKALRVACGMSQTTLAELVGVTYQQIAKNEAGVNGIAASRLFALAHVLGVGIEQFFEGLEAPDARGHISEQRQIVDLARHFRAIATQAHRQLVLRLTAALAGVGALAQGDQTP
jgi:transcriptional regulator with XRE-family HTH domain